MHLFCLFIHASDFSHFILVVLPCVCLCALSYFSGLEPEIVRLYTFQLIQAIHWCHSNDVLHRYANKYISLSFQPTQSNPFNQTDRTHAHEYNIYNWLPFVTLIKSTNMIEYLDPFRDIKPENLLINVRTQTLKLCDFGFARIISKTSHPLTGTLARRPLCLYCHYLPLFTSLHFSSLLFTSLLSLFALCLHVCSATYSLLSLAIFTGYR